MIKPITEDDLRKPEFRGINLDEYEWDGTGENIVRKDRWEMCVRSNAPLSDTKLEPRTLALLEASGMVTVGHLLNAYYEERLRSIEGIGVRRAGEVYFEVIAPIQERSRWFALNRKSRKKS